MKRTAIITGSEGGIGHALVNAFRSEGYCVVGIDKEPTNASGADVSIAVDIANLVDDHERAAGLLRDIDSALPGAAVHVLVNNAAVQILGDMDGLTGAQFRHTLDTNVIAPYCLARLFRPRLAASKGSVINIASIHAKLTKRGFVAYATSKGALLMLTRALAIELGGSVRVNAISPAATETPMLRAGFAGAEEKLARLAAMHPLGRIAQPSEVARVALFLASDDASFVTGANVEVDGGIAGCLLDPEPFGTP